MNTSKQNASGRVTEDDQGIQHLQILVLSLLSLLRNRIEHENSFVENEALDDQRSKSDGVVRTAVATTINHMSMFVKLVATRTRKADWRVVAFQKTHFLFEMASLYPLSVTLDSYLTLKCQGHVTCERHYQHTNPADPPSARRSLFRCLQGAVTIKSHSTTTVAHFTQRHCSGCHGYAC